MREAVKLFGAAQMLFHAEYRSITEVALWPVTNIQPDREMSALRGR